MGQQIKTVKIEAGSTKGWLFRPVWQKSMDQQIAQHNKEGWTLTGTVPITNRRGETTHYLLTFSK